MLKLASLAILTAGLYTAFSQPPDRRQGGMPEGAFMRFNPLLKALDSDHDGVISAEEINNAPKSLKSLDKNNDGKLTEDELRPAAPANAPRSLMSFDKNGDGKLSKDELPERMQGMFDRIDTNKDGFLSADEVKEMEARRQRAPEAGYFRSQPVYAALDADHDGVISAEELEKAPQALKALDKNGDGKLTEDEVRPNFGGQGRQRRKQ